MITCNWWWWVVIQQLTKLKSYNCLKFEMRSFKLFISCFTCRRDFIFFHVIKLRKTFPVQIYYLINENEKNVCNLNWQEREPTKSSNLLGRFRLAYGEAAWSIQLLPANPWIYYNFCRPSTSKHLGFYSLLLNGLLTIRENRQHLTSVQTIKKNS